MSLQQYTSSAVLVIGCLTAAYAATKVYFKKSDKLGPPLSDTRFKLNYVGHVDRIYDKFGPKPFEFNRDVVKVFDDMVSRSVPLYEEVIDLLLYWVHRYYVPGTKIYDLGCSTGTTFDVIARSMEDSCHLVGIDNSIAMVEECRKKLEWAESKNHIVDIHSGDILDLAIDNASFVIMNYTLQFIPVASRHQVLSKIFKGLQDGGVVFISEKVRSSNSEFQEACTWIYEDFKERRGYTKTYIARKKDALMNVLVPFTEEELRGALTAVGFENVEIAVKWNNFSTFVARKSGQRRVGKKEVQVATPHLDSFFESCPTYLSDYLDPLQLQVLCLERLRCFTNKSGLSQSNLLDFEDIARCLSELPSFKSKAVKVDEAALTIGDPSELTIDQHAAWLSIATRMKPWKKGPLNVFGVEIDTEWRSDLKWGRMVPYLPPLKDKVICDLGCGNGYFMYRMLSHDPKLVVGIDPNVHAWMEFKIFQRFAQDDRLRFEFMRGDAMTMFTGMFDVVFCLGVLYHTNDPVGMLRDIYTSMTKGSTLIVDCQGIPGDEAIALFPKKKYANMKGVYFLPTATTLMHWLSRAQFQQMELFFSEPLTSEEQRITKWAPVTTSLGESLDPNDATKTVEGYPAPHRFYIRAKRG